MADTRTMLWNAYGLAVLPHATVSDCGDTVCRLDRLPLGIHPDVAPCIPVQSPMVDRAQSTARGTAWHAILARTPDAVR